MAANTFSIGTLKNRVAGYDPQMAASLARIAKTGKMPETTRYQEEMVLCRNRMGMMGFFSKVVDECASGEAVEVYGWYAGQDPATHAPFVLYGPFKFGLPDNKGLLSLSAYVKAAVDGEARHTFVKLDGLGVVARENGRRAEYVALLKAWGISEEDHRTRFDAHAAARKAAADSVAVPSAELATNAPSTVVRAAGMPTEGRVNDGVIGARFMSEGESSIGSMVAADNAEYGPEGIPTVDLTTARRLTTEADARKANAAAFATMVAAGK